MKIGLITYNKPHRKTYDLACMLKMEGYKVVLLMVPFDERKERTPLIKHRPEGYCANPRQISAQFDWDINEYRKSKCDVYLVGGCGVIPGLKALNAHPGFLPHVRGLDALKWAIYHGLPIGVTVHETTDEPDKGPIYARRIIPLYFEDTFHSFAYRTYQIEIEMLVASIDYAPFEVNDELTSFEDIVHKRMPAYKERIMLEKFEALRRNSKSIYPSGGKELDDWTPSEVIEFAGFYHQAKSKEEAEERYERGKKALAKSLSVTTKLFNEPYWNHYDVVLRIASGKE